MYHVSRKMKLAVFLTVVISSSFMLVSVSAGEQHPFGLILEISEHGVSFETASDPEDKGTYSSGDASTKKFFIDPTGVATLAEDLGQEGYCFSVEYTANQIVMTSLRGTNWHQLMYSSDATPFRVLVTENGVSGIE